MTDLAGNVGTIGGTAAPRTLTFGATTWVVQQALGTADAQHQFRVWLEEGLRSLGTGTHWPSLLLENTRSLNSAISNWDQDALQNVLKSMGQLFTFSISSSWTSSEWSSAGRR